MKNMKPLAVEEYKKRGKPAKHTKWSVDEICRYMQWKLAILQDCPNPEEVDVGGVAAELPKSTRGKPASLPSEVLDWETRDKASDPLFDQNLAPSDQDALWESLIHVNTAFGVESTRPKRAPYPKIGQRVCRVPERFPSSGYTIHYRSKSGEAPNPDQPVWSLALPEYEICFDLEPGSYMLYPDDNGHEIIWRKGFYPKYCQDLMEAFDTFYHGQFKCPTSPKMPKQDCGGQ